MIRKDGGKFVVNLQQVARRCSWKDVSILLYLKGLVGLSNCAKIRNCNL